jgi:hypothetical protein
MDFCLKVGLKDKYIELCNKYIPKAADDSLKEKYNSIKYEILGNTRQIINKMKTVYDKVQSIQISELQAMFREVKSFL